MKKKRWRATTGRTFILVLLSGGGLDVSFAHNHPKIGAILWARYPAAKAASPLLK